MDFSDTEEDQRILELPAEDNSESDENTDAEPRWHKKDATVKLWGGNWNEGGEMIASSLAESDIRFRADDGENGSRSLFVRPQDESRAREIVREVTKAEPK